MGWSEAHTNPEQDLAGLRAELDGCRAEIDRLREAIREVRTGRLLIPPMSAPRWYEMPNVRGMGKPLAEARPDLADCLRRSGVTL